MKRLCLFYLLIVALFLTCCTKVGLDGYISSNSNLSSKYVNFPTSDSYSILIKLENHADESTINNLNFNGIDSIEKVFISVEGKEELEKACGLDRWYEIFLDIDERKTKSNTNKTISNLAEELSKLDDIAKIQFSTKLSLNNTKVIPYNPSFKNHILAENDLPFNDPYLNIQWNFNNSGSSIIDEKAHPGADINIYDVWNNITYGDSSIIVAIIDEGVMYNHPDLAQNMWCNVAELNGQDSIDDDNNGYIDDIYGYNFIDNSGNLSWNNKYDIGHGTHCAGVIAAVNNNGIGISSIAGGNGNNSGCKIMSCQIFSGDKGGNTSQTAKSFQYAANNGASIASCSWGISSFLFSNDKNYIENCGIEYDAIRYFELTKNNSVIDGGIAIFAAGNSGNSTSDYPGATKDFISVTAYGPDGLPTYYTNYGPGCNICAPGGEIISGNQVNGCILSTVPPEKSNGTGYAHMNGTSMACPHVSGIAALGISYAKKLGKHYSVEEFKDLLLTSTIDINSRLIGNKVSKGGEKTLLLNNYKNKIGTGGIDCWQLMMKIEGTPSIITKIGEKQWVPLSNYFGLSSESLHYLKIEIKESSLDLAETPYIENGNLFIHPQKIGSAKLIISAIAGGNNLGGGNSIGGKEIKQEVSIISKYNVSANGGWF